MPAGPFRYIEAQFEAELEASRVGRRFREWMKQHPTLQRFEDIDALIAFQWDESIPFAQSNEVTFLLCELAGQDPAAKLLLLRLYVPGLMKRWNSLRKGALPRDEVASELVTGFLIRATKLERGTENLSNRLLGAATDRVQDAIEKRLTELAHEFAAADTRELADGGGRETDAMEEVLAMVEQGHVSNVLVWRLDRLSRDLGDLIDLAETFAAAGVGLHSFTENLDLSSATGRMFYNILGAFAQFYREQLAENVRMGLQQAARQGRWVNRPKFGYDLKDGVLIPNADAPTVQRIFRLRSEGLSFRRIEELTGVKFCTVRSVLHSRIYLGEVLLNDEWFPGQHEPIITPEEFAAAHRGFVPGWRRRSQHVLTGRVRCGLCGRLATIRYAKARRPLYRCRTRHGGCDQPARSADGLIRAALLGLRLISGDTALQKAIRRHLKNAVRAVDAGDAGKRRQSRKLEELAERRRKLLELHYQDKVGVELFAEEEEGITREIETLRREHEERETEKTRLSEVAARFEKVAEELRDMDLDQIWEGATDRERRVLVEELLEAVAIFPDHLEVTVEGVPRLNVTLEEAGLKPAEGQFVGVGGEIRTPTRCYPD